MSKMSKMIKPQYVLVSILLTLLSACTPPNLGTSNAIAPGAPGTPPFWNHAGKTGIGVAYEQYANKRWDGSSPTGKVSKVWFSLAQGIITETMFGLIHEAQIKELQFIIKGEDFVDIERTDTVSHIEYLHTDDAGRPLSLAYKLTNRDREGQYEIEKHIFTHPDQHALFVRVIFRAFAENITPYAYLNPHMNNTGIGDFATASPTMLQAWEDEVFLTLKTSTEFHKTSAGFAGVSDGLTDLQENAQLDWQYASTGETPGNVALVAELGTLKQGEAVHDLVIGFGQSRTASEQAADDALQIGYQVLLDRYNGIGKAVGWEDYLASLPALDELSAVAMDGGKLLYASALVLKAQEDKTYPGALIASLSNPWGDTTPAQRSSVGYKAVWPRDFYQCAMAMLALGDTQTPLVAFEYLQKVQVGANTPGNRGDGGWFLQKTHVNGVPEWVAVQLDQTAMPIMLGWKLWQAELLDTQTLAHWYRTMLKSAADFLVAGGDIDIDWNKRPSIPPRTQQERWEEQWGYSPSSIAATIAGLVTAADIANHLGDTVDAKRYLATADDYASKVERYTFTIEGAYNQNENNGRYFLRLSQNTDPNDGGTLEKNNGRPAMPEDQILDAGFLELVRYGIRAANDPHILDSLPELDDMHRDHALRVKYEFTFEGEPGTYPGWRRYGNDGYGEDTETGLGYAATGGMTPHQRGRVWPFLTGERGHYELASALRHKDENAFEGVRAIYVKALELFANSGLMLPEQVWDGIGKNSVHSYQTGQGSNAATPLAWTHAEYVKLLRSLADRRVWDYYDIVGERYLD